MAQTMSHTKALTQYQWLAFVVGVIYLTVGVAGFFITGAEGVAERGASQKLFGLAINQLHDVVHLSTGFLGVIMWSGASRARAFGWSIVAVYSTIFLSGLTAVKGPEGGPVNIDVAGSWLHILTVVAGLLIALWPDGDRSHPDRPA
ncbi:DUF4383 domain-containing protein [Promicromonospora sp. NPDC023987]|uniref:DUF4383 domain-containing protein n=1 Tax=Promicromonospora sp. NPDC023987 TaxID=3155360 RepID=UPI0033C45FB0